jgi:hypothetical protein
MMESLPDEILSIIFRYLHRFGLIYSFGNLNQRFQCIIEPYLANIDLTQENLSYGHFSLFSKHIVPKQAHQIRLLKLGGKDQLRLFHSHIHHLINLESLTLKSIVLFGSNEYFLLPQLLTEALKINSLSTLLLSKLTTDVSEKIASFASQNLTRLTVLDQFTLDCSDEQWLKMIGQSLDSYYDQQRMFTVKCFSIHNIILHIQDNAKS